MPQSAGLPRSGRSHRNNGRTRPISSRSESVSQQGFSRSKRQRKGTDTPGKLFKNCKQHRDNSIFVCLGAFGNLGALPRPSKNSGPDFDLFHEDIHPHCVARWQRCGRSGGKQELLGISHVGGNKRNYQSFAVDELRRGTV